jgi:hypothetical protein
MSKAEEVHQRLQQLEAERLVLTVEIRNALLRAAKELLPEAIAQASAKNGSPALLRLITRLAMRPTQIDRPPQR